MTFPQKTKWFKRPIGWEDLGQKKCLNILKNNKEYRECSLCSFCYTIVNIGKDEELFLFCPRCLVKINQTI